MMAELSVIRWLRRGLVVSLCCLLLLLTSCGGNSNQSSTPGGTGNTGDAGKTLTVGTEPAFAPFEFKGTNGELQGFSIDLMNAIGKAAGIAVKFQSLPFDGLIPAIQGKTIDAAISSMTITKERSQTVDFSRPYFKAGLAIAVRSDNTDITNFVSLENKRIAVQIGTTGAEKAKSVAGAKISSFDSAPLALQELKNGNVDAVINDAPVTLYAIKNANLTGIKVVGQLLTEEFYGIATAKNSPNLASINQALGTILGDDTYTQIYKKWFNAEPPKLPEKSPFTE